MLCPFILYRWATFALFVVCSAVMCSVAAWNLSFVQLSSLSRIVHIDAYLIFLGALGLVVIFPIIFVDLIRKGAISSRVWFEVSWVALFWILNFSGAAAVTAIAPDVLCDARIMATPQGDACTSSRVLVVFAWLNTAFLFSYFFVLCLVTIIHQKEDNQVWHTGVRDFQWFATKQCLRSAPTTPVMARFSKAKPPSLVAPKPRRPPPIFVQQRAGLSSQVEIEHFPDPGSFEDKPMPPVPATRAPSSGPSVMALYPQHVQSTMHAGNTSTYHPNTYYPSKPGSSPPPIRNWPRPIATNPTPPLSERAAQKQKAKSPEEQNVSRSTTGGSAASRKSARAKTVAPPPLILSRSISQDDPFAAQDSAAPPSAYSPNRSRPTGPRTRASSTLNARPRPPPLDLTRNGSTPSVRQR